MTGRDTAGFYSDGDERVAPGHKRFALDEGGHRIHDAAAATGDYVSALINAGRDVTGSDLNADYVEIARSRELPVTQADARDLPLADNSVDTVLLFEVLEHVADAEARRDILREAARVARRNVLITTPDSTHLELLRSCGLTYEHMLDRDHKVFYDRELLESDLHGIFARHVIRADEATADRFVSHVLRGDRLGLSQRFFRRRIQLPIPYRFFVVADVAH